MALGQSSAGEPRPWEAEIQLFEKSDRVAFPHLGSILFVGSSSIRLWDLEKSFKGMETVNRGFGGAQVADVAHFVDRIVIPYRPRIVVVYAGDNDVAAGKSAEVVARDVEILASRIRAALPGAVVVYLSIKPSLARWDMYGEMARANRLAAEIARSSSNFQFLDISTPMLDALGRPRPELFLEDGLHLNAQGYELWTRLLMPVLAGRDFPAHPTLRREALSRKRICLHHGVTLCDRCRVPWRCCPRR